MPLDFGKIFKNSLNSGAVVGVIVVLLSWLFTMLNNMGVKILPTISNLFAVNVPLTTGITSTAGQTIFDFVQGVIPYNLASMTTLFIILAGIVTVFIGNLVLELLGGLGVSEKLKTWVVLLIGTIGMYFLLTSGFKLPGMIVLIGLVIYYFVIGLVFNLLKEPLNLDM